MAGPDLSVFGGQTLLQAQQLQTAFEAQKALQAAQTVALVQKAQNGGVDTPSAVAEYQYVSKLPPEQQQQYLNIKRATQTFNLGDHFASLNPLTGQASPVAGSQVQVSPDQQPALKGAQAAATNNAANASDLVYKPQITAADTVAKGMADVQAANVQKAQQADNTLNLVNEARQLLPQATSGSLDTVGKSVKGLVGYSDSKTNADSRLNVIASGLTSAVPRMQGPQSDRDVQLYQQAAGDVANTSKPAGDRIAALKTIEDLQNKYKANAGMTAPTASFSATVFDPKTNQHFVVNSQQDLQEALAEGAVQQ